MYRYDQIDADMLADRTAEFRDQCARRLAGGITEEQFKPIRLKNGLYLQLHAYMLRIAIPYGTLDSAQMRMLAHVARTYDRGYGHFTTRTNLQLHWIKLRDAPDILADLAKVGLHAIQTSGNCIRNVTSDPLGGRGGRTRSDDPRVWCRGAAPVVDACTQSSRSCRASSRSPSRLQHGRPHGRPQIHDVGLRREARRRRAPWGSRWWSAAAWAARPTSAQTIQDRSCPAEHLLSYLTGRAAHLQSHRTARQPLTRQRIKILVAAIGG